MPTHMIGDAVDAEAGGDNRGGGCVVLVLRLMVLDVEAGGDDYRRGGGGVGVLILRLTVLVLRLMVMIVVVVVGWC